MASFVRFVARWALAGGVLAVLAALVAYAVLLLPQVSWHPAKAWPIYLGMLLVGALVAYDLWTRRRPPHDPLDPPRDDDDDDDERQ